MDKCTKIYCKGFLRNVLVDMGSIGNVQYVDIQLV